MLKENLLSSLWKIDEKTSADILAKFYEYLSKGDAKGEALRKAKLHFINVNRGKLNHPYYWAGLALIGNDDPVYTRIYTWPMLIGGIAFVSCLAICLLFFFKRRS